MLPQVQQISKHLFASSEAMGWLAQRKAVFASIFMVGDVELHAENLSMPFPLLMTSTSAYLLFLSLLAKWAY